ncbi:MAG: N-acetylglucosamine kinase [Gaiellaceae bacterium]
MRRPAVLAVDGGNSKTDLALVGADGELLALVRGPTSSPQHLGLEGCVAALEPLLAEALADAGLAAVRAPLADVAAILLAGVDFSDDEHELEALVDSRGWASRSFVRNDTFAVLRAGSERGWGVAVVAGAGINCVGVAADGRELRFPALGEITGDWGGGIDVGRAALSAASRSADGRGPRTSLEQAVPAHFDLATPLELATAIERRQVASGRLIELAPIVFAQSADDAVAAGIVDRVAAEVVALARAALVRLGLTREPVEVLLGGGLLQAGNRSLLGGIVAGLGELSETISVRVNTARPIVGAALLGLDELGAGADAQARLRGELGEAVERLRPEAELEPGPERVDGVRRKGDG